MSAGAIEFSDVLSLESRTVQMPGDLQAASHASNASTDSTGDFKDEHQRYSRRSYRNGVGSNLKDQHSTHAASQDCWHEKQKCSKHSSVSQRSKKTLRLKHMVRIQARTHIPVQRYYLHSARRSSHRRGYEACIHVVAKTHGFFVLCLTFPMSSHFGTILEACSIFGLRHRMLGIQNLPLKITQMSTS